METEEKRPKKDVILGQKEGRNKPKAPKFNARRKRRLLEAQIFDIIIFKIASRNELTRDFRNGPVSMTRKYRMNISGLAPPFDSRRGRVFRDGAGK